MSLYGDNEHIIQVKGIDQCELKKKVHVLPNNEVYRYGDVVNYLDKIVKVIKKEKEYESSLLFEWLQKGKMSNAKDKYDHLCTVVKNYSLKMNYSHPYENALVIHIRAGDDYKGRGLGSQHIKTRLYMGIQSMIKTCPEIDHIVIVTALHYGVSEGSTLYGKNHTFAYKEASHEENIRLLYHFINAQPIPVYLRSTSDIDSDFCFLCHSKYLLVTGGGFSKLVKEVRNRVFDDVSETEKHVIDCSPFKNQRASSKVRPKSSSAENKK